MLRSLARKLVGSNRRPRKSRACSTRPPLRLEALESRLVPSCSPVAPHGEGERHRDVTVMTYNLNNGSDLLPLFSVTKPQDIPGAVSQVLAEVTASDIPDRAVALAHVIEASHADLIGVQEASVWSVNGVTRFDLLGDVMKALAHDGAHYRVASTVNAFGGQLPDAQGQIVGLQDQNAILVRTDLPARQFQVANVQTGFYTARFNLPLPGLPQPIPALDSWQSVDVTLHGERFRFFNTHLDSDSPLVNDAQAKELVALVGKSPLPVIVVGDFNAEASGAGSPTYSDLTRGGLHDAWSQSHPGDPGLTWGATPPSDPKLQLSQRIDLIFSRGPFTVDSATRVGNHREGHGQAKLWPSDHLGVVVTLDLP
jgi:endonuclease/exonuclease/phosphatase family metal-dependent hydrolase